MNSISMQLFMNYSCTYVIITCYIDVYYASTIHYNQYLAELVHPSVVIPFVCNSHTICTKVIRHTDYINDESFECCDVK